VTLLPQAGEGSLAGGSKRKPTPDLWKVLPRGLGLAGGTFISVTCSCESSAVFKGWDTTMAKCRGFKQLTLQDRLTAWAKKTREHANELEPGPYRDVLLQKADQAESAARFDAWSRPSGSQPPTDAK
jgi:hypothetical protein